MLPLIITHRFTIIYTTPNWKFSLSMNLHVCLVSWLTGQSVSLSVIMSLNGRKFHYYNPIGKFVFTDIFSCFQPLWDPRFFPCLHPLWNPGCVIVGLADIYPQTIPIKRVIKRFLEQIWPKSFVVGCVILLSFNFKKNNIFSPNHALKILSFINPNIWF